MFEHKPLNMEHSHLTSVVLGIQRPWVFASFWFNGRASQVMLLDPNFNLVRRHEISGDLVVLPIIALQQVHEGLRESLLLL